MRKISIWLAVGLICAAVVITHLVTTWLDLRVYRARADKLAEAADMIQDYYIGEVDRGAMTDEAIRAMVDSLGDRWSYYLTAEDLARYQDFEGNRYQGLGFMLTVSDSGELLIPKVYDSSPAGRAGIPADSVILSVGGTDVQGADLQRGMDLISAGIEAGSVTLELRLPDGSVSAFTLEPGQVDTDPVTWELLPEGLGYIRITNFEDRSGEMALEAIDELVDRGAAGLVFDVRDDPGGQLHQLLLILDRLLPEGKLFISRWYDGDTEEETSDAACLELPMAVLVNDGTYSAAEFFAAALQEYDWALIVGQQTTGKGRAQVTMTLKDGSALHLSVQEYFTPQGRSLADTGVTPDLTVELGEEQRTLLQHGVLDAEEDGQLTAARQALLKRMETAA